MEEKKDKAKPEEKKEEVKKKEKDGLNDIILDKINANKKPKNIKKILLGISSMILLFLVVLLIMKFINSSNEEESVALIPSKNTAKTSVVEEDKQGGVESKQEDEDIFKKVPVEAEEQAPSKEIEEEDNFDEMVKSLKEKEIANQKQKIKTPSKEKSLSNKTEIEKQIKKEIESPKNVSQAPKVVALAKNSKKVKEEREIVKADGNIKVPKVAKPKREAVKSAVSCPTPVKVNKVRGYFIQVSASFKTLPSKEFLRRIDKNGFRYIIKKSTVRGQRATKVLVGPYYSKDRALRDLPKVKEVINPDAFIVRIK